MADDGPLETLAEQLEELQEEEEEFIHHEIFQKNCYEPLQPIDGSAPLIVDVGANVGLFALWARERWTKCQLICIEPLPPNLEKLQENLEEVSDVLVLAAAVGAQDEVAEFTYFPWAPGESTRHAQEAAEQRERVWAAAETSGVTPPPQLKRLATPQLQQSFQCSVQRLSTLLRSSGMQGSVELLKVDVEGDEEAVFQSIDEEDWPRIRQVVAEVHDIHGRLHRIQQLLPIQTLYFEDCCRTFEMQLCPRWYAIPVNLLSFLAVLYALAAALKFSGAAPDLKERSFVLAVIRWAFLLALPFLFFSVVFSVRCVQRLPADEAAMLLFRYWKDATGDPGTKELPEKFQGVFWFSTDPSPELCVNFQAAAFDAATRTIKLYPGSSYTWVWCDSCVGWAFYLFFAFVNPIYSLQMRWEEGYQKAYLPSILFGCFNIDWLTCSAMYIEQIDENEFARTTYVLGRPFKHGSYSLKKVVDKDGRPLPAFDDMILSLKIHLWAKAAGETSGPRICETMGSVGARQPVLTVTAPGITCAQIPPCKELAHPQEKGFEVEVKQQLPNEEGGYFAFVPESLRLFHLRAARPRGIKREGDGEAPEEKRIAQEKMCAAFAEGAPLREATAFGISRQFFLHTPCESLAQQSDRLFETFETRYWRPLGSSLEGLLVVATTYYNFLRLRRFLREEGASFSSIFEYSTPKAVGHARQHFFQNERRLLLVTERFLWYRRFRLKGANYVLFYGVPQTAEIYEEVLGAVRVPSQCNSMCLFTKHDAFALERIVGHERAKNMLISTPGKVFVYS
eukprot:s336_g14.t1